MTEQIYIGDLCELKYGDSLPERNRIAGSIPVYGSNGVVGYHNERLTSGETLVIGRKGSVGKVHYSQTSCFPIDTTYYVDKTKKTCNFKWLYYYLQTLNLPELNKSSAVPGLNRNDVYEIKIKFPSIKSQEEIAKTLEEADIARQKRKAANALTDQFLQSTFLSMFGDPILNEKNWQRGIIRDVVTEVKYGTSKPAEENGSYPYLRMNNIDYSGNWDFSSLKFINLENDEREKYLLRKDDLIFNRTNSKELVGKTAVYNLDKEMAIAGYLIRVRTNERANPYYLWAYLNSKRGKSVLFNMCKNIVGMANINAQELQDIQILIPPLSLQQKFASIVVDAEQLRRKQKQSEIELENLFQALLQKYFG